MKPQHKPNISLWQYDGDDPLEHPVHDDPVILEARRRGGIGLSYY